MAKLYTLTYAKLSALQTICSAVPDALDETIAGKLRHFTALNHKLTAPPAAPQVSGQVRQTSFRIPRSIHCFLVWFKVRAEST